MLNCADCERLIARVADEPDAIADSDRRALDAHLAACADCRAALEAQRDVARVLAARVPMHVPTGFSARLTARVHGDDPWLALVNWRAWTVGLAPIAAALLLVAWLSPIAGTPPVSYEKDGRVTAAQSAPATFDAWAASGAPAPAAAFLQPDVTGDSLLEVVLTGGTSSAGTSHVR